MSEVSLILGLVSTGVALLVLLLRLMVPMSRKIAAAANVIDRELTKNTGSSMKDQASEQARQMSELVTELRRLRADFDAHDAETTPLFPRIRELIASHHRPEDHSHD